MKLNLKERRFQILVGAVAVQALLIAVVYWPRGGPSEKAGEPLLPDIREKAERVTIEDSEGNALTFAKENGEWVLPDADNFPVESGKAGEFLDKIAGIAKKRLIARTKRSHKQLKVAKDEFERKASIEADGKTKTLYIGSAVGARSSHTRLEGENETYIADDLSSWQAGTDMSSWVDTEYFKVDKDAVQTITLKNDEGQIVFERDEENAWTIKGLRSSETMDESKMSTLLNRLSPMRMTKPLGKEEKDEYGFSDPAAVISLEIAVEAEPPKEEEASEEPAEAEIKTETRLLRIGRKTEDEENYAARSSDSLYYVELSRWSAGDFATWKRSDFLKE